MHAWLSNVVRLSRCRDRRPRNRPVLRVRPSTPGHRVNDVPRTSAPARPAHPGRPRTRAPARPAPCVGRRGDPAPGTRRAARGIEAIRIAIGVPFKFYRGAHPSRPPSAESRKQSESRSRRRPHARAAHIEAFHSFTHYVHSHTEYRRATVSYRVIMRTYEVEIGPPARNR